MADNNDNPDHKPSSLELISKVWSSLTSNEEPNNPTAENENNDIGENTLEKSTTENENNDDGEPSLDESTTENVETEDQPRKTSIFSNIFSSFSSTDKSENDSSESTDTDHHEESVSDSTEQDSSSNDSEKQRHGSFISDLISSFTSSNSDSQESTERTMPENETDDFEAIDESIEVFDDNPKDDSKAVDRNDSFDQRVRSSSMALCTEPENIDSKDLDYVTLVSS